MAVNRILYDTSGEEIVDQNGNVTVYGIDGTANRVNKVQYGRTVLIDITDSTAIASDVALGETFYTKDGVKRTGTKSDASPIDVDNSTGSVSNETLIISSGSGGGTTQYIVLYDNTATITADPDVNYIWINNQPEDINVGDRYRVTWNNVAYTTTAVNDSIIGQQYGNTFGNPSILGGTDDGSNAPFCAFKSSWSDNELIVSTSDSVSTITLKIEKIVYGDNLNLQSKTVTSNGTVTADSGYDALSSVNVNVSAGPTWATGTFTPSSATTSVTFDTTLSTIHGILIVPTSATPFSFSARTQVGMIVTPNCYYKSISLHSNQGGTGFQTPSGSTSNTRMTQNGTSVTITAPYNFRALSYTWFAW